MLGLQLNSFEFKNYVVQKIGKNTIWWRFIEYMQGVSYRFDYWRYYKSNLIKSKTSITEINIEFVSYCNLRCKLCSLDHSKPKTRMSAHILRSFFLNFLNDKRFRSVKTIHLYNAGEVLLHPQLEEMLCIIKEYKRIANSKNLHFPKIALLTNATILNTKNSELLIHSKVRSAISYHL